MQLQELQLGDVVSLVALPNKNTHNTAGSTGQGTIIGLDHSVSDLQVMVGWNGTEAPFRRGTDNYDISRVNFIPNVRTAFECSLWVDVECIVSKISCVGQPVSSIQELPCRQCGKLNDTTTQKCWWCETANPTSR